MITKRFTFAQFVHYGIHHGGNVVNGMPWSFKFYGHPVTHLTDDCYLICSQSPDKDIRFNRTDEYVRVNDDGSLKVFPPVGGD